MKKILFALLLVNTTMGIAQEKVLLRLNYEKGDTYETIMKMGQDMGVAFMEMEMKMQLNVTDVKENEYLGETKFTYLSSIVTKDGEEQVNYNSNMKDEDLNEEGKKFKDQMSPMMKAVMFMSINKLGESKLMKVEPNTPGISELSNQSNSSVVYPKEEVSVGSTWTNIQSNQGINMELTYTVKEIVKDKVVADMVGKMSLMPTADITGSIEIDRNSGIPVKTLINIEMDMMGNKFKNTTEAIVKKI
ncbi:hypothetical protein C7447_10539 [Tenacibaculum adriaticum]|uniref:Uncharacterized protein n=1 Tax=Tenacibaculum adriaticum TaxID=413713 RepID=A0A5S5DPS5_9FLAO|nr:hypothetical protein [Tenacibaculum adriaticum]TYP97026.1 hypothetical protein C7447_10539 [Tenacibaculum adriaticum]